MVSIIGIVSNRITATAIIEPNLQTTTVFFAYPPYEAGIDVD